MYTSYDGSFSFKYKHHSNKNSPGSGVCTSTFTVAVAFTRVICREGGVDGNDPGGETWNRNKSRNYQGTHVLSG